MKKNIGLWILCVAFAGAILFTQHAVQVRTVHSSGARVDAAGIGGDWWTDLILEVNNYSETFHALKWFNFQVAPMAAINAASLRFDWMTDAVLWIHNHVAPFKYLSDWSGRTP